MNDHDKAKGLLRVRLCSEERIRNSGAAWKEYDDAVLSAERTRLLGMTEAQVVEEARYAYAVQFLEYCEPCADAESRLVGAQRALCPKCAGVAQRVIDWLSPILLAPTHAKLAEVERAYKVSNAAMLAEADRANAAEARLAEVERERDGFAQYHGGHLPSCGGRDEVERRCGCGYLQGEAYRDLVAERDRLRGALEGLVKAATDEANEKGCGGYLGARLSDARAALEAR